MAKRQAKPCLYCNTLFNAARRNNVFCSANCQVYYGRENKALKQLAKRSKLPLKPKLQPVTAQPLSFDTLLKNLQNDNPNTLIFNTYTNEINAAKSVSELENLLKKAKIDRDLTPNNIDKLIELAGDRKKSLPTEK
jgi:hypothetical protein